MPQAAPLHLIPVGLSESPISGWLPADVKALTRELTVFIAENAKTARAFLKLVEPVVPLQEITIHTLDKRGNKPGEMREWLKTALQGQAIGLVSEAGCPAVADPGALVVAMAHEMKIPVRPHVGPSSILLSLMASGLDGQQFVFHGYAPVDGGARAKQLKQWESQSQALKQTQILIETPYRNQAMYSTLLQSLKPTTRLCLARDLTGTRELIQTATVEQWRERQPPALDKTPCIFLFLAGR
ncbi:SAM-dependent methyltransferase [Alcaligenes sp. A-TC2]|uniref:SAM-dependent methyltransferase n=1 Tax=Alcaligenes TaxID=507 RepID=UPI000B4D53A9|nr:MULTISPECIES: SAM-dependent methyltransferase [Alcaligenes]ASC89414.1 SAM-dependent methyltransferase [Alcaligenes faecalis]MCX5470876.1 SAM-dependent methyltransferase [Alcaligenes nematophilus]URW81662.1 SAM-dependent methyltransferase [Alcaligenes sp. DN25]USY24342.1 SAM-dependent methyltransferase [Alcaligenes sp. 1735tsa3]WEA66478.1 SAM-dependent methyltransferase [Alcaligenes faecalis]